MIIDVDDTKNSQEKDKMWETWEIKQIQFIYKKFMEL